MTSEFEIKRKQRLFDDLSDIMIMDSTDDDIVCGECGSPLFILNSERGIVCADCDIQVEVTELE